MTETTVAVSREHLQKLRKICIDDERTMKVVVKRILDKYFEERKI